MPSAGTFHRRRSHTQGAADHDPVFGAPMLHLERKARPKIDDFVLDLKALARVETVVGASRAIAFRWASTLRQRRGVKLGEDVLDLMELVRPPDQHGIGRFHGYDVPQAPEATQAVYALIRL